MIYSGIQTCNFCGGYCRTEICKEQWIPVGVNGLWVVWTIRIGSCLGAVPFIIIIFGQRVVWW
jgi:hypothetical protein